LIGGLPAGSYVRGFKLENGNWLKIIRKISISYVVIIFKTTFYHSVTAILTTTLWISPDEINGI